MKYIVVIVVEVFVDYIVILFQMVGVVAFNVGQVVLPHQVAQHGVPTALQSLTKTRSAPHHHGTFILRKLLLLLCLHGGNGDDYDDDEKILTIIIIIFIILILYFNYGYNYDYFYYFYLKKYFVHIGWQRIGRHQFG